MITDNGNYAVKGGSKIIKQDKHDKIKNNFIFHSLIFFFSERFKNSHHKTQNNNRQRGEKEGVKINAKDGPDRIKFVRSFGRAQDGLKINPLHLQVSV